MPSRLLLALILLACAHRAAAQAPSPGPLEVIPLADGNSLVGRVTPTDEREIHIARGASMPYLIGVVLSMGVAAADEPARYMAFPRHTPKKVRL